MPTNDSDLSKLRISRDDPAAPAGRSRRALWFGLAAALVAVVVVALVLLPRAPRVQVALAQATGGGAMTSAGITANGYVVARTKASVSAKVPGQLEYLGVSEGTHVRKGQIIARIENDDYRARLAAARAHLDQAEAQLAQSRRDLSRTRQLRRQNLVSASALEDAETGAGVLEAQAEAARADVQLAEVNLENTRVRAPFDGTVLRKDAEVGEFVAPASAGGGLTRTAIVTMADLATLEVEVDVNEAYISQVHNGQAARITLDAYPDTSFAGSARQVVPTADRDKATVLVKVSILDRDPRILPEMGAKVTFLNQGGPAVAAAPRRVSVPADAVVSNGDRSSVWIVHQGRAEQRDVEVGPANGNRVEIRRGLEGGESVMLDPPPGLRNGTRVRAISS